MLLTENHPETFTFLDIARRVGRFYAQCGNFILENCTTRKYFLELLTYLPSYLPSLVDETTTYKVKTFSVTVTEYSSSEGYLVQLDQCHTVTVNQSALYT